MGNAIKLLGQALRDIEGMRLAHLEAGVAHNVIPREGSVGFTCLAGGGEQLAERLAALQAEALAYLPAADSGLEFALQPANWDSVLGVAESRVVIDLVAAFPHGAQAYSLEQPADLVDLSVNLAIARLRDGELFLETSFRFFNLDQSQPLQQTILALAAVYGLTVQPVVGYPGWQPDFNSALLARGCALHERLFGQAPAIKAIHAGLECGLIGEKFPGMDMLAMGPQLEHPHSPEERVDLESMERLWKVVVALLEHTE